MRPRRASIEARALPEGSASGPPPSPPSSRDDSFEDEDASPEVEVFSFVASSRPSPPADPDPSRGAPAGAPPPSPESPGALSPRPRATIPAAWARLLVPPHRNALPSAQSASPAPIAPSAANRAAPSNGSAFMSPHTTSAHRGGRGGGAPGERDAPPLVLRSSSASRRFRAMSACLRSHRVCKIRTCVAPGWKNRCALATVTSPRWGEEEGFPSSLSSVTGLGSSVATMPTVDTFASVRRRCGCARTHSATSRSSSFANASASHVFRSTASARTSAYRSRRKNTQHPSRLSPVFSAKPPAGSNPAARICGSQNRSYHFRSISCRQTTSGSASATSSIARGSRR